MNAFRNFCAATCAASLSVLALGALAAPAQAAYPLSSAYCRDAYFGNTLQYYPTTSFYGRRCRTTSCVGSYNVCPTTIGYPVTLYDAFGRPVSLYPSNCTPFVR
jgi:hypothetical protein